MTRMNALSASLRLQGMLASCLCPEGIEHALLVHIQGQGVFHDVGRARMSYLLRSFLQCTVYNPMSMRSTHRSPHRNEAMR